MATKLKNMRLTSVDLVRAGANQEADICLFKSAQEPPEQPESIESAIGRQILALLRKSLTEGENEPVEKEKDDHATFDEVEDGKKANETLEFYLEALEDSYISIQRADTLTEDEKESMMIQSLNEFNEAMKELIPELVAAVPWDEHDDEPPKDEKKPESKPEKISEFEEIEEFSTKKA